MASDHLRLAMKRIANDMHSALATSGAIDHALTTGEVRESEIIGAFRPHLPTRYELRKGIVVNASGEQSEQQDIVISDSLTGTPFLAAGEIGVFPVEIVFAVLQVKSRVSLSSLGEAIDNLVSAKRLASSEQRAYTLSQGGDLHMGQTDAKPFGAIFAFNASQDLDAIAKTFLIRTAEIPSHDRPDALLILDRALICWGNEETRSWVTRATESDEVLLANTRDALLLFYLMLHTALATYQAPALRLDRYVSHQEDPEATMRFWTMPTQ